MLKEISDQLRDALLNAARGSELIAAATGETVSEVLERNIPRKSLQPETNVVAMRREA